MRTPGERIGAILSVKDTVRFLGYGSYAGHEVPPNTGPKSMTGMLHEAGATNPKLVLDNGLVVWGCECWWDSESAVKAKLEQYAGDGLDVVDVTPAEMNRIRGNAEEEATE